MKTRRNLSRPSLQLGLVASLACLAMLAVTYGVYNGLVSPTAAEYYNRAAGSTPFFRLIYERIYEHGLTDIAIIPLLLCAPVMAIVPFIAWAMLGTQARGALTPQKHLAAWAHPLCQLQFPFLLVAIFGELTFGQPLAAALFGEDDMYSMGRMLWHGTAVILLLQLSLPITVISSLAQKALSPHMRH